MTVGQARAFARDTLEKAGIADAHSDADWMLLALIGGGRAELPLLAERTLPVESEECLRAYLRRRVSGEPLQYILGTQDFLGLTFRVDARVLIPRPETELLAELAIREVDHGARRVLDLCCGSGCIGVSIAKLRPAARVWATDASGDALIVARENARLLGVEVAFGQGDLFAPVGEERFDLIVSNPPYIPRKELTTLAPEVQREPAMALDGGPDGLDFYRRIAREAPGRLSRPGTLLLEVGHDQAESVAALLRAAGAGAAIEKDLQGIARFVKAAWREGHSDV